MYEERSSGLMPSSMSLPIDALNFEVQRGVSKRLFDAQLSLIFLPNTVGFSHGNGTCVQTISMHRFNSIALNDNLCQGFPTRAPRISRVPLEIF